MFRIGMDSAEPSTNGISANNLFRLGSLLSSGAASSIGAWYDALARVTPADLQAAAALTFVERSRTVGHFIPEAG